jgi:hypothetical protein
MKLSLCNLSCNFVPRTSKCSPCTLFSYTLKLISSLGVRKQVSHSHKTTGKIIVLGFFQSLRLEVGKEDFLT